MLRRAELLVVAVALVLFPACCRVGHAPPGGFSAAEYAARAEHTRKNAPPGFTTVVVPPFIVIGDGPPDHVRNDAE